MTAPTPYAARSRGDGTPDTFRGESRRHHTPVDRGCRRPGGLAFHLEGRLGSDQAGTEAPPPIWIGANADPAIERAVRLGDGWYVNPHHRLDTIVRQVEVYQRALERYGKPSPQECPARHEVFTARSRDEAIRLCAPFLGAKY